MLFFYTIENSNYRIKKLIKCSRFAQNGPEGNIPEKGPALHYDGTQS